MHFFLMFQILQIFLHALDLLLTTNSSIFLLKTVMYEIHLKNKVSYSKLLVTVHHNYRLWNR